MIQASNYSEITDRKDNSEYFHIRNILRMHIFTEMLHIYTHICMYKRQTTHNSFM